MRTVFSPYTRALCQMHLATVLFGLSGIFGRLTECSSGALVCGRALFGVAVLGLLCLYKKDLPWQGLHLRSVCALLGMGTLLTGHYITFFMAIKLGGVAIGSLGFACFPAFTALCEALAFRIRPTIREIMLVALVSCGLCLITPSFSLENTATIGLLWGVISGAVYSLLAVANRFTAKTISGVKLSWCQNLVIIILLLPVMGPELAIISAMDWLWIACLGLVCTGLAYTLFVNSLAVLRASLASMIISLEPVYSTILAWMLFQEDITLRMILGGTLIVGSVIWAGRR